MAGKWKELHIEDIADVIGGGTPSTKDEYNFNGTIPWVTPKDLSGYTYRYISHGERSISEKGLANSSARLLPENAVLLTTRAPVGYVAIAANPITTNQGFRSLIVHEGFSHEFVYYLLIANTEQLKSHATGTTFGELSGSTLKRMKFLFPPFIDQHAIASILGALDDKIELNRKMNETLEAMARAIFKSWFVDFDPVRAKAEGQAPPGLKPEIGALFPNSFEDSDLGEIPKGWRVCPIGDVVQVLGGGTPSTKEPTYWEGGIHPFCTPKDMASLTDPVLLQTERHLTDEGLTKVSSGQLPVGTVMLSSRAPIGYLAIAETPVSINQGIVAMVCDGELPNLYVLHWTSINMDRIIANANGSTFLEISKRNFRPITVVIPEQDVLQRFTQIVEPLYQRVVSLLRQIQHLAALRDALLPKLISGELRVPNVERIVGRSV